MRFFEFSPHVFPGEIGVTFATLLSRATHEIRRRVRNGEVSERRLAHLAGLSQPHVHNVLKGVRLPSPESVDRLMRALGIRMIDLLSPDGTEPGRAMYSYLFPAYRAGKWSENPPRGAAAQVRARELATSR